MGSGLKMVDEVIRDISIAEIKEEFKQELRTKLCGRKIYYQPQEGFPLDDDLYIGPGDLQEIVSGFINRVVPPPKGPDIFITVSVNKDTGMIDIEANLKEKHNGNE